MAVQTDNSGDFLASKTRIQPELETYAGDFYFRTTLNAVYDDRSPSLTEVSVNEAYMEYTGSFFDIRAGRQIIVWGQADGVQITDIISPKDRSQAVVLDYEDTRLPVNAVKARLYGISYTLEAIWIPLYSDDALPENSDNPLTELLYPAMVNLGSGPESVTYALDEGSLPNSLFDGEAGFRGSLYLPAGDVAFSLFSGWDNSPANTMEVDGSIITITPDYARIWMVGIDTALPLGAVVLRGEGAWISGRSFSREDSMLDPLNADQIKCLAGIDWNPGSGWSLTGQYIEDIIPDYKNGLTRDQRINTATFSVSKNFFRETLDISTSASVGLKYFDSYSSIQAAYDFSDEFSLTMGVSLYMEGLDEAGEYGEYTDLSCVWTKGRFSF